MALVISNAAPPVCACVSPNVVCDGNGCYCTQCGGLERRSWPEHRGLPEPPKPPAGIRLPDDMTPEALFRALLVYIGEDPDREGLLETPKRVAKAWREWASGYGVDPASVLKTFEDGAERANEMVIVHNIPIISKCEHHLADIVGHAHIGYIPKGRIVGLSKLARLADVFGRRLQVQERLTNQIADALQTHLDPVGVGVLIRAHHGCMSTRGVKIHGSTTTTSAMRGVLLKEASARAEFLELCAMEEKDR